MDKIIGEVDAVDAGEDAGEGEKTEVLACSHQEHAGEKSRMVSRADDKNILENVDMKA